MHVLQFALCGYLAFVCGALTEDQTGYNRFEYEYSVLQKLAALEEKSKRIDGAEKTINELKSSLSALQGTLASLQRTTDGSSYVRWGRSTCPDGSILVYEGYTAGAYHQHTGNGANYLCLHSSPTWNNHLDGEQYSANIYGTEYFTNGYSFQQNLFQQDVPCVVCRIPRTNVLMVPGRNICDKDYKLEYSGYLMTEHFRHANNADYICVDDKPDTVEGGSASAPGKYLFFVEAYCGSLKCPPYVKGWELTCAVCSFNPIVQPRA